MIVIGLWRVHILWPVIRSEWVCVRHIMPVFVTVDNQRTPCSRWLLHSIYPTSNCKGRHVRSTRYISLNGYFSFWSLPNRIVEGIILCLFDRTYCTYIWYTYTYRLWHTNLFSLCMWYVRTSCVGNHKISRLEHTGLWYTWAFISCFLLAQVIIFCYFLRRVWEH